LLATDAMSRNRARDALSIRLPPVFAFNYGEVTVSRDLSSSIVHDVAVGSLAAATGRVETARYPSGS